MTVDSTIMLLIFEYFTKVISYTSCNLSKIYELTLIGIAAFFVIYTNMHYQCLGLNY